jgi:hypothetical protein
MIGKGRTTAGSGGSSVTPVPIDSSGETAAAFSARANDTTQATAGTEVVVSHIAFNARVGIKEWYPPECRPGFSAVAANNRLRFSLQSAPTNALTLSGTFWVGELG